MYIMIMKYSEIASSVTLRHGWHIEQLLHVIVVSRTLLKGLSDANQLAD